MHTQLHYVNRLGALDYVLRLRSEGDIARRCVVVLRMETEYSPQLSRHAQESSNGPFNESNLALKS